MFAADCGSENELFTAKFRLKLKRVGKTTRPFSEKSVSYSVPSDPLLPHGLYSLLGSYVHAISQVRKVGGGSHSLLRGIVLTQGSNLDPCKSGGFFTRCALRDANTQQILGRREGRSVCT